VYRDTETFKRNPVGKVRVACNIFVFMQTMNYFRKEEAANRPKVEFVPKSLADLHIEGVSDGVNGIHHNNINTNHHNIANSGHQFKRPAPRTIPTHTKQPDPFDPWSFPQGIFCFFLL
jgi:hypothetical protein